MDYQTKNISARIKDVDFKERTVSGYFSIFNVEDSDGDIIKPGAFAKTVAENGPDGKNRIMHLWQHNPTKPLSKPKRIMEDDKGLFFESKISETTWGTDALKLYKDGVIEEHSIGFNTVKSHWSDDDEANIITEVKLWEGSSVTWGANEFARMTDMKGTTEGIFEYYNTICKAFYRGDYTDETFRIIEAQKEHLEQQIKTALDTSEPPSGTPSNDRAAQLKQTFKNVNRTLKIRGITNGRR